MNQERIASSEVMNRLYGKLDFFQKILKPHVDRLIQEYAGKESLPGYFRGIPHRIICICPMALCDAALLDIGKAPDESLLAGLGLSMYSISTHDDVVDESPETKQERASLIYSGNIATLQGIRILMGSGHQKLIPHLMHLMNLNHCFQTDIAFSIWQKPSDEAGYLDAIKHTGYWASIGPVLAMHAAGKTELIPFAEEFGKHYGLMCQLYDDVREINDDLKNGYFSLPISTAIKSDLDLNDPVQRVQATKRSKELAANCFFEIERICDNFPRLLELARNMHIGGSTL